MSGFAFKLGPKPSPNRLSDGGGEPTKYELLLEEVLALKDAGNKLFQEQQWEQAKEKYTEALTKADTVCCSCACKSNFDSLQDGRSDHSVETLSRIRAFLVHRV